VIADSGANAVYIATPNTEHRAFTERAAAAGVHVLCEKPMASSSDMRALDAVLQLEQKEGNGGWERNDRLVLVPERGGWTNDVRDPEGLPKEMRHGLEAFPLSTHFFSAGKARRQRYA
jgi:hypothetical protein